MPSRRRRPALDLSQHGLLVDHRDVARRFLHQDAVRGAPLDRGRQVLALEQAASTPDMNESPPPVRSPMGILVRSGAV